MYTDIIQQNFKLQQTNICHLHKTIDRPSNKVIEIK